MGDDDGRLYDIIQNNEQGLTDYINSHKYDIHDLVNTVKCHVDVDRDFWGGSIGKGTSLGPGYKPDFDINLIFNLRYGDEDDDELQYLLWKNMEDLTNVLRCDYRYKVLYETSFATGVLIRQTRAKVDLIPAINFSRDREIQYEKSMVGIVNSGYNKPWLNPSYSETSVHFLKGQELFVRDVVKLAKYWNKNCVTMSGLTGRSVIVETVAIYAAQEEMESDDGHWSLARALEKFFNYMAQDWRDLCIVVNTDIKMPRRAVDQLYKMKRTYAVILDPVNPYRNFLDDQAARNKWGIFQNAARRSLDMYYKWQPIEWTIGF